MEETKTKFAAVKAYVLLHKKTAGLIGAGALLIIVGLIALIAAPREEQNTPAPRTVGPWQEYKSSELGFTISHPSNWTVTETNAESGPDILVLEQSGTAFVRIRGFLDTHLNSEESLTSSIDGYQKSLARQSGIAVSDFQTSNESSGAKTFSVSGQFPVNNTLYRFLEIGKLDTSGQVLIIRAADTPELFDESSPTMQKIMDSFVLE